jgi:hypothetical protein
MARLNERGLQRAGGDGQREPDDQAGSRSDNAADDDRPHFPRSGVGWLTIWPYLRSGALLASGIGQPPGMQDRGDGRAARPQPPPREEPGMVAAGCAGETLRASLAGSGFALRPATLADAEFCYQLHKAAMGEYITAIWGWDESVRRAFHQRAFDPRRWQIIIARQVGIGVLDVDYRPGKIYLSRIEIDPGY